ncbi:SIR2 family protein [Pseudoalteromonas distincta]|uniref:SIR2 family protein n=1 Tax=Pseudoalteromonas distincta TaxID=77608 RepID=UPI0039E99139
MNYERLKEELSHKERFVPDLISHIGTRTNNNVPNYSLLLGAGASFTSGIRTGANLVSEWKKEAYFKLSNESEYEEKKATDFLLKNHSNWYSVLNEYSALFEYKFDLPSQRRRFVEHEVDGKLPSIGYSYLVSLTTSRFFDTIYTTNFDDLLNEAFYQFSQSRPIVCAHDSSMQSISINSSRPKIIKLHGDYLFDDIKSTLRETETLESNTKSKLTQFSKEYGLIVMGYAGNDRSIMDVINFLLKSDDHLKNGVYWCIRKDDYINPELTKLLWKDRVYFVNIDGFDEAMAQIHHGLKKELSLDANFKNSKKESILSSFTKDDFKLSEKSNLISFDIENLTKHKNNLDISNLIRELNEKEFNGSEDDFKTFLSIDRLIKDKNFDDAINIIKNKLIDVNDDNKEVYLKKLIKLHNSKGNINEAYKLCDELISMDPYQVANVILKSECYSNLSERAEYIQNSQTDFEDSYPFHNYLLGNAIDEIKFSKNKGVFSIDTLIEVAKKSLKLEPSLDNIAWLLYLDVISLKFEKNNKLQKKDKEELIEKIIEDAKNTNPNHVNTQKILLHHAAIKNDYLRVKDVFSSILDIVKKSSKNKKLALIKIICDKFHNLSEHDNSEMLNSDWTNFIKNKEVKDLEKFENPIFLIVCKAHYQVSVEKDVKQCLISLRSAISHTESHQYASSILQLYLSISDDHVSAHKFLDRIDEKLENEKKHLLRSNIYEAEEKYDQAIQYLNKSREAGSSFSNYIIRYTYLLLKDKKFTRVKIAFEESIPSLEDQNDKDILTINKELAEKEISGKVRDKVAIRNIISRKPSQNLILAAECLLENDVTIKRLLNLIIEKDYSNLFYLSCWPVIPSQYFDIYKLEKETKNDLKEMDEQAAI